MNEVPKGQRLRMLQLLVQHGELTGGDMLDIDENLPRGTIYVTLMRLEKAKLVKSRKEAECRGPGSARRFYKITALGERATRFAEMAEVVMSGGAVRF